MEEDVAVFEVGFCWAGLCVMLVDPISHTSTAVVRFDSHRNYRSGLNSLAGVSRGCSFALERKD